MALAGSKSPRFCYEQGSVGARGVGGPVQVPSPPAGPSGQNGSHLSALTRHSPLNNSFPLPPVKQEGVQLGVSSGLDPEGAGDLLINLPDFLSSGTMMGLQEDVDNLGSSLPRAPDPWGGEFRVRLPSVVDDVKVELDKFTTAMLATTTSPLAASPGTGDLGLAATQERIGEHSGHLDVQEEARTKPAGAGPGEGQPQQQQQQQQKPVGHRPESPAASVDASAELDEASRGPGRSGEDGEDKVAGDWAQSDKIDPGEDCAASAAALPPPLLVARVKVLAGQLGNSVRQRLMESLYKLCQESAQTSGPPQGSCQNTGLAQIMDCALMNSPQLPPVPQLATTGGS